MTQETGSSRAAAEDELNADYIFATSLPDVIVRAARFWPDATALVIDDERRTYRELVDGARRHAAAFLRSDLRRREHVGLHMPVSIELYEAMLGATMVGATVVPLNYRARGEELAYTIEDADCGIVLTTERYAPAVDLVERLRDSLGERIDEGRFEPTAGLLRQVVIFDRNGPTGPHFELTPPTEEEDERIDERRWMIGLGEPAIMLYTSGTTSKPKGVHQTHEALSRASRLKAERWRLRQDDGFLNPLPSFHAGGVMPLLNVAWVGAKLVGMPYFDPARSIELIDQEHCTVLFTGFPKITSDVYEHEDFKRIDLSHVRLVSNAAPPDLLIETEEAFPNGSVVTPYGGTEVGNGVSFSDVTAPLELRLTSGRPFKGIEVRIVDPTTEEDLGRGALGEIQVRSFAVMTGYHNDPERSAEAVNPEGWIRTGDRGELLPTGEIRYLSRIKEMMKVGGENVAPLEIESVLLQHDDVLVAQVAGVPDRELGEVPAAWVELVPGVTVREEDLIEYCRPRIARFKVPRHVRVVTEWPMSATKVQKNKLVEALREELEAKVG